MSYKINANVKCYEDHRDENGKPCPCDLKIESSYLDGRVNIYHDGKMHHYVASDLIEAIKRCTK